MQQVDIATLDKSLSFDEADLTIQARLNDNDVTIDIVKSGTCVHRLTIADAVGRMENSWIADLFAREDRLELNSIAGEVDEYVRTLNISQG
ncbi:MAG: hypothetical protein KKB37_12485 [Alphaproteobacteria bacterium]|nr:hypothetical protein [Alphaproteobacteria bacterium]